MIVADVRGGEVDDLLDQVPDTARALPAVEAGQIVAWPAADATSYRNVAANVDDVAAAVEAASADVT